MPNRNYNRGAALERKLVTDWRAQGRMAYRVAGSRGAADVVALRPGDNILAQCKTGGTNPFRGFGPTDRKRLSDEAAAAGCRAVLVWRGTSQRGYQIYEEDEWPAISS